MRLKYVPQTDEWLDHDGSQHLEDLAYLRGLLNQNGHGASDEDIELAWREYSDFYDAGWLDIRETCHEFNLTTLLNYLKPESEA